MSSRKGRGPVFIYHFFYMRIFRAVILVVTGLFIYLPHFCPLVAQNGDVHLLDSLLVSGSSLRGAAESSSPLQRLTAADLARMGVTTVGDALKFMSGVTVRDYGGVGGLKTVGIRGLGAQHTAVFYDGVAIGDCQSGQVDLGRYSTENLSGVELTIGQGDDIYKSARVLAAAGVVSLETPDVVAGDGVGRWQASGRVASFDTYKGSLKYSRAFGKGWGVSSFGEYVSSQGEYPYKIKNPTTTVSGRRANTDVEELRGEVNLSWQSLSRHFVRMKMYAYGFERGLPGGVIVNNPLTTDRLKGYNVFGQLFYEYLPSQSMKMKFALKHNITYDNLREPLAASVSVNSYRQRETDFSATFKWAPSFVKGLSFAWSEEIFKNTLRSTNNHVSMPTEPERVTTLSAVSARYNYRAFSVTGSLLHTYAAESAPGGDVAPDRSRFSPSVAISYYPFVDVNLCLRASYKSIFRLPTFNDLYYREIGNYKLLPERTRQYNAGAAYSTHSFGCCDEFTISADVYYGKIKDKIVAVPGVFVWRMSNVDRVETFGADVNVKGVFSLLSRLKFQLSTAYSYMRAENCTPGSPLNGHQIVYTPRHSGAVDAAFVTPLFDVGYSLLWSGMRYHAAQNIRSNEIDAYGEHSLWLSRTWKINRLLLLAKAEVKNITDDNYEIIRYYPMPGRNYVFTMKLTL